MVDYFGNSKKGLLQYAACAGGIDNNGLESDHEFQTRIANERGETLLIMEFYREIKKLKDQEALWNDSKRVT